MDLLTPERAERPATANGPFQFTSVEASRSPIKVNTKRKGHKYKHSSVSLQLLDPPSPKADLPLPVTLHLPTLAECVHAMDRLQQWRMARAAVHASLGIYLWTAQPSRTWWALGHVLVWEGGYAVARTGMDVLANFDVWHRSSLKHPFGLQRWEVVGGFAAAVFLLFLAGDVIKEGMEGVVEGEASAIYVGQLHVPVLALLSTLAMQSRFSLACLPVCVLSILLAPLDLALALVLAGAMAVYGVRMVRRLGTILLLGNPNPSPLGRLRSEEPAITEARLWQVHHQLGLMTLRVHGEAERVRQKAVRIARETCNIPWEISMESNYPTP